MLATTDKRTGARPQTISGVTFNCWHTGILRYEWRSDDNRLAAGSNYNKATYYGEVDGQRLGKKFRTLTNAMAAAVAQSK